MPYRIPRAADDDMFGPTTGDRLCLADTELVIEVERDLTVYGEEVKFGGGKVTRDGMGQSQATNAEGAADTVVTNALIIDHWGIVRPISASRTGEYPASARPAIQTCSRMSRSSLAPAPRSLQAKARSSRRARSHPPFISSAHRRQTEERR